MKLQLFLATLVLLLLSLYWLAPIAVHAQVGMGTTAPDAHAILDLHNDATPRGLLLPRMSTAARTTLGSSMGTAQVGLMVADTSAAGAGVYVWDGIAWANLNGGGVVNGSGTVDYLNRWTAANELGNSVIRDDGTSLGIGIAPSSGYQVDIHTTLGHGMQIVGTGTGVENWGLYSSVAGATGQNSGVYSVTHGNAGDKYSFYGRATGDAGTKYGVWGAATGEGTNWAGFFAAGNVHIQNHLGIGTVAPQNTLHVNGGITATGMSLIGYMGDCRSTTGPDMVILYRNTIFIPPGTTGLILHIRGQCNNNHEIKITIGGIETTLSSNFFSAVYAWASPAISIANPPTGHQEFVLSGRCPPPGLSTLNICEFNVITQ